MPVATYRYQALAAAVSAQGHPASGDVRRSHALAVVSGLVGNGHVASLLVSRYFRLGAADAACKVFDAVPRAASASTAPPKPLLYSAMLRGYLAHGLPHLAVGLFREMACPPDHHTYRLAVTARARASELELGRRIGSDAAAKGFASDLLVATALIGMYSGAGDMVDSRMVFDEMPPRDAVVWNAVIAGYARSGCLGKAVELFKRMRSVDGVLLTEAMLMSLVSSYAGFGRAMDGPF